MTVRSVYHRCFQVAVILLATFLYDPRPAAALTCAASVSAPTFGQVDLLAGVPVDTVGSMMISCSGAIRNSTVLACPNLTAGSGNGANPGPQRLMVQGNAQLLFNIYRDAYATVWGGGAGMAGTAPSIFVTIDASGNGMVANIPIYARIGAAQSTLAIGTYSSVLTVDVRSSQATGQTCGNGGANAAVSVFTISATYSANCFLATSPLNFGNITSLTAAVDAETAMSVTCSSGTAYSVALDRGLSGATALTQRAMQKSGYDLIYGLYLDQARQQPWGALSGMTRGGIGTGTAGKLSVYGRIPTQTLPPSGAYRDTVVATVTY